MLAEGLKLLSETHPQMPHLMGTESFTQEAVINSDSDDVGIYSLRWKDGCVFFLAGGAGHMWTSQVPQW